METVAEVRGEVGGLPFVVSEPVSSHILESVARARRKQIPRQGHSLLSFSQPRPRACTIQPKEEEKECWYNLRELSTRRIHFKKAMTASRAKELNIYLAGKGYAWSMDGASELSHMEKAIK